MADRPYHHGNLRAALLGQAERTLREQGSEQLSLRELARQVGVSHGAPRRHFADRQALLDALAETGFARLGDELRAALDAAGDDYQARFRATASAYVRFATRDAALLDLMFAGKNLDQSPALHDASERAFAAILELIQHGQHTGMFQPGDPERTGLLLFATLHGIAALVTAGMIDAGQLDGLVADAVAQFMARRPQDRAPALGPAHPAGRGNPGTGVKLSPEVREPNPPPTLTDAAPARVL
jgi:AcrR family transcriptional regulator